MNTNFFDLSKRKKRGLLSELLTDVSVDNNLDKAPITIRTPVFEHLQSRISRSYIVDLSHNLILREFKAKGKNSKLMHNIVQKI